MADIRADRLERALDALDRLAGAADRPALATLHERLSERRLRILVAGEAKRGKSTLINRLVQRDVLPTGVTPVTAIVTTVRDVAGADEHIVVTTLDGDRKRLPLEAITDYVPERANPGNARRVLDVLVNVNASWLDRHRVEIVDTPGTGSVFAHNTAAAEFALESLDAAIFVVTADPPISAAERDLLARVAELSVHTVVVLNKADQLDAAGLDEAYEFTARVCAEATGEHVDVFTCSARAGREDPGYRHFVEALDYYLAQHADADADAALSGHLTRMAEAMLDAARLTARALDLNATSSTERVALFRDRLAELNDQAGALDDQCWAAERRLRRALDDDAVEQVPALVESCLAVARTTLDGPLGQLDAAAVERDGRALVDETIGEHVERWRSAEAAVLARGLESLTARAIEHLQTQLTDLRTAAREWLGVDLSARAVTRPLEPSTRFWYDFGRGVGVEPPLADVARAVMPGRNRRARARVLNEIPQLVDRQVGRARSDLAQRLRESVRQTVLQLRAEHEQVLDGVRDALDQAAVLSAVATGELDRRRADLAERIAELGQVIDDLSTITRDH